VTDRLYRSPTDRVIAGVAGGLAVWLNIDPSLVRVAWVILAILSGGIFLLVYFVMMIVVPLPPPGWVPTRPLGSSGAGPGAWPQQPQTGAWTPPPGTAPGTAPGAAPGATPGWMPPAEGSWTSAPPPNPGWTWGQRERTNAGIVFGVVLVGLGVWFLIDQYVDIDWRLLWPVIVIVVGVALIAGALRRARPPG
jgi:phage shock protein PspC (stress-responsive transcriptional regulator)